MLTNILWKDYLIGVACLVTIYYLYVLIRYYRKELKHLLAGKRKNHLWSDELNFNDEDASGSIAETLSASQIGFNDTDDDFFEKVEQLLARAKGRIADASGRSLSDVEFKLHLHLVLVEYPAIKESSLRPSINETLAEECKKYNVVALSEEEVDMLW